MKLKPYNSKLRTKLHDYQKEKITKVISYQYIHIQYHYINIEVCKSKEKESFKKVKKEKKKENVRGTSRSRV
jgi:hypothetical protein